MDNKNDNTISEKPQSLAYTFSSRLTILILEDRNQSPETGTRKQLAQLLGVSIPAVRKWEKGDSMPEPEKIIVLAEHYKVSVDWLLGRTEIRDMNWAKSCFDHSITMPLIVKDNDGVWTFSSMVDIPRLTLGVDHHNKAIQGNYLVMRSPSDAMWPTIRKDEFVIIKYGTQNFDENQILLLCFDGHLAIRRMQRRIGMHAVMADNRNHYPESLVENEHVIFLSQETISALSDPNSPLIFDCLKNKTPLRTTFYCEGKKVLVIGQAVVCSRCFN